MVLARFAVLSLGLLLLGGCNNSTPGGGPLTHSTALPSVQGSYTGSTAALGGGTITFTIVGTHATGDLAIRFTNDFSTPPAYFDCITTIDDFYSTSTRQIAFASSDFGFDTSTGDSYQNDYDGVITINPDRTFTLVLDLQSNQDWDPGTGTQVSNTWDFNIVYSGAHDPGI
jgi:hypothetical protein